MTSSTLSGGLLICLTMLGGVSKAPEVIASERELTMRQIQTREYRAKAHLNDEPIGKAETYEDFFSALDKSMFIALNT